MQLSFDSFYIEPIRIQDAWNLCNFIVANEDRLKPYFPRTLEQNLTPELSKFFVEKKVKQFQLKKEFLFTLKENSSNQFVGLVYIKELDWVKKQGELQNNEKISPKLLLIFPNFLPSFSQVFPNFYKSSTNFSATSGE